MARMSRRRFLQGSLAVGGLGLLSGCKMTWPVGQQPTRVPVIGFLAPGPREARAHINAGFFQGLRDLGYVDGQNIAIEQRFADSYDRLPDLAAELAGLPVDVLVAAAGTPTAVAARQATATIPIVFTTVGDPVGSGLVASLARPGGNLTGMTNVSPVLSGKRVELLKAMLPGLSRLAILVNETNPVHLLQEQETTTAVLAVGIELQVLRIRSAGEYEAAFRAAAAARADALYGGADSLITTNRDQVAELGLRYRLPTVLDYRENADAGGLLAYGPSPLELYRHTATFVDKILKGARPADLPVEQPTIFELVVNLKTAQVLGLTIPQSVLQQATEVIQ